jgi:hypothetical protein
MERIPVLFRFDFLNVQTGHNILVVEPFDLTHQDVA